MPKEMFSKVKVDRYGYVRKAWEEPTDNRNAVARGSSGPLQALHGMQMLSEEEVNEVSNAQHPKARYVEDH